MLELVGAEELVFTPCTAGGYVNGRENTFLGQRPVELYLAIAGPLELLENDVVHPGPRFHEGGGDNRQRTPSVLGGDRARRAEKGLRLGHRGGVQSSAQSAPRSSLDGVECASHPRDRVEHDDDILA